MSKTNARVQARKRVSFGRAGGSRTVVLPKAWLETLRMQTSADLVLTDRGILIEPAELDGDSSIEDDPHFSVFLEFLAADALRSPEKLIPADDLVRRAKELTAGVEIDD